MQQNVAIGEDVYSMQLFLGLFKFVMLVFAACKRILNQQLICSFGRLFLLCKYIIFCVYLSTYYSVYICISYIVYIYINASHCSLHSSNLTSD